MKTAIVHEWITARAGSELCFERIAALYPEAELFALARKRDIAIHTNDRSITGTFLGPLASSTFGRACTLPLMPAAYRHARDSDYDIVITSSHAFSRAFAQPSDIHLSYTYTPMRYAWYPELDRRGAAPFSSLPRKYLQTIDLKLANSVTSFASISSEVADRVADCYGRPSRVIFPPCDTTFFRSVETDSVRLPENYILSIGRLIPYKRHDIAIELGEILGIPVVVAGVGPEMSRLRSLAKKMRNQTVFLEGPSRETVRELYSRASFTLFPPHEDFGIVPVESLACGTPVVALDAGGAVDTVVDAVGRRAHDQRLHSFASAALDLLANRPSSDACVEQAANFAPDVFDREFAKWVAEYR